LSTGTPAFQAYQQQQLNANNTVPLDIRPLRMTVKIKCTTQNMNIASNIAAVLIPQSISLQYGAASTLTNAAWTSLWQLCESNPKAISIPNGRLAHTGATFVMPPSSFQAYNSYFDWIPLTTASDNGAALSSADWLAVNNLASAPALYPAILSTSWFGVVPSNYVLLINMEPNALAQSFEIEVFCQDGVRFPANSLAASMEHRPSNVAPLTEVNLALLASRASTAFSDHSFRSARSDATTLLPPGYGGGIA